MCLMEVVNCGLGTTVAWACLKAACETVQVCRKLSPGDTSPDGEVVTRAMLTEAYEQAVVIEYSAIRALRQRGIPLIRIVTFIRQHRGELAEVA